MQFQIILEMCFSILCNLRFIISGLCCHRFPSHTILSASFFDTFLLFSPPLEPAQVIPNSSYCFFVKHCTFSQLLDLLSSCYLITKSVWMFRTKKSFWKKKTTRNWVQNFTFPHYTSLIRRVMMKKVLLLYFRLFSSSKSWWIYYEKAGFYLFSTFIFNLH